jgi:hypothetical protein
MRLERGQEELNRRILVICSRGSSGPQRHDSELEGEQDRQTGYSSRAGAQTSHEETSDPDTDPTVVIIRQDLP